MRLNLVVIIPSYSADVYCALIVDVKGLYMKRAKKLSCESSTWLQLELFDNVATNFKGVSFVSFNCIPGKLQTMKQYDEVHKLL